MTVEQKYLDFLDALIEIERRTCSFQSDPEELFEKDFWVSREYMKRKEEEISIIKITDFKLDEKVREEYLKLDLLNLVFLTKKIEKRFRRQSEVPMGENHFYIEMAHIINQSVLDALDSVGFPKPVVGIRSNWMFVNFQGTSFQITNVIKLYSHDQCERIFYEILRILLPELKRIKLMKTLEEIIIFVKKSLKKKIIEEEAPDIIQEIKNDCQKLLKEKELENNKLIKHHENKYRVLLDENKSLLDYKIKLEKLEKEPSTIQIAEIKISEKNEEKIVTPPPKMPKKKKIAKKKKVAKKVEPKKEIIKPVEVVEEKKPVEKKVKPKKVKKKKKAKKTKKAKASKKKTKKAKKSKKKTKKAKKSKKKTKKAKKSKKKTKKTKKSKKKKK